MLKSRLSLTLSLFVLISAAACSPNFFKSQASDSTAWDLSETPPSQNPPPQNPPPQGSGTQPFASHTIPGVIQAEDFDLGPEGSAYFDSTPANLGQSPYRETSVDIKPSTDMDGGHSVGWMSAGEWLVYTVQVSTSGTYSAEFRVATPYASKTFHLEIDGTDVTGRLTIPTTGSFDTVYGTVVASGISLTAGKHVLRLVADTDLFDVNYIKFVDSSTAPSPLPSTVPNPTLPSPSQAISPSPMISAAPAVSPALPPTTPAPSISQLPTPTSCPAGSITIFPGQNIQTIVTASAEGASFCIKSGVHRLQKIIPKNRMKFYGESGAVLNGSKLLTSFSREGNYFVATGQTQGSGSDPFMSECNPRGTYVSCALAEGLFINDQSLKQVDQLSQVQPGMFFFDYANDRIYFLDDPTNKKVEASVTDFAFYGNTSDVVIKNLTIEKYSTPTMHGVINPRVSPKAPLDRNVDMWMLSKNWLIENNVIQLNHGAAINAGEGTIIRNNKILRQGQIGLRGRDVHNVIIEGNEIGYNNANGFDWGFEGGGTKLLGTVNTVFRGNYAHHNAGAGLWSDYDNYDTLYENNTVEYNSTIGIFHECNYRGIIRNNISRYNSNSSGTPWLWGAQILAACSDGMDIHNNTVVVGANGGNGIVLIQQDRYGHYVRNNKIHHNTITYLGNIGYSGGGADFAVSQFNSSGNQFYSNTYTAPSMSGTRWFWNSPMTYSQWKSIGQD